MRNPRKFRFTYIALAYMYKPLVVFNVGQRSKWTPPIRIACILISCARLVS